MIKLSLYRLCNNPLVVAEARGIFPPAIVVAGEKLGFYVKHSIVEIPTLNDRINVAKKIVSALPRIAGILSFDVTFSCTGIHQAHGYIYNGKQHGIIKIDILFGGAYNVKINNGEYTVM